MFKYKFHKKNRNDLMNRSKEMNANGRINYIFTCANVHITWMHLQNHFDIRQKLKDVHLFSVRMPSAHMTTTTMTRTMTTMRRRSEKKEMSTMQPFLKDFAISTTFFIRNFSNEHSLFTIVQNIIIIIIAKYSQITVNYWRHGVSQWLQFIGNFKKENSGVFLLCFWPGNGVYHLLELIGCMLRLVWLTVWNWAKYRYTALQIVEILRSGRRCCQMVVPAPH